MSDGYGDSADHGVLAGLGDDDHPQYLTLPDHSAIDHDNEIVNHDGLENVTADQHHNEDHAARHSPGAADELTQFLRSSLTPTTPTRAFDTTFQPSATRPVWVSYTIRINMPATIGADTFVVLLSDASSPPTTPRARARIARGAGDTGTISMDIPVTDIVPAGHNVRLALTAGAGSAFIEAQTETPL